jgi:hypothetical protein
MRQQILAVFLVLAALVLPSCSTDVVGYGTAAMPALQAVPAGGVCAAAAQPVVALPVGATCAPAPAGYVQAQVVGVQPAATGQQLVAVQYRVGAEEWTRATLQVPGSLVICAGNFLYCALDALFPRPKPTAVPMMAPVAAPAGAAPCAPGPPVSMPCPEPVAYWPCAHVVVTNCAT